MKRFAVVASLLAMAAGLYAAPFSVSQGQVELYNAAGVVQALDENAASNASTGWIVRTKDDPIVVATPIGVATLAPDSILVIGSFTLEKPTLYLVQGEIDLTVDSSYGGTLEVCTTAARYDFSGGTDLTVVSTDDDEQVDVISGSTHAVNRYTHRGVDVPALTTYFMKDNTFEQLLVNDVPAEPVPAMPRFTEVTRVPGKPVFLQDESGNAAVVVPVSTKTAPASEAAPAAAPAEAQQAEAAPAQAAGGTSAEPAAEAPEAAAPAKEKDSHVGISMRVDYNVYDRDYYEHQTRLTLVPYIDTPSFALGGRLYVQTWTFDTDEFDDRWEWGWNTNLSHFDTDRTTVGFASVMDYIDFLRIGKVGGYAWFTIDKEKYAESGSSITGLDVIPSDQRAAHFGLRFGDVRIRGSFDDVSLHNIIWGKDYGVNGGFTYGNMSLSIVDKREQDIVALGMIYGLSEGLTYDVAGGSGDTNYFISYPYVEARIPFVNKDSHRFGILGSASTYMPLAPDFQTDKFYNSDDEEFDNYMVNGGIYMGWSHFDLSLLGGYHEGISVPFVRSAFTRAWGNADGIVYDSDADIRLTATWKSEHFSFGALYNFPLDIDQDDGIAHLKNPITASERNADYLAIGTQAKLGLFRFGLGYEVYGISDTTNVEDDLYQAYSISLGMSLGRWFDIEVGARKPVTMDGKEWWHDGNYYSEDQEPYLYVTGSLTLDKAF